MLVVGLTMPAVMGQFTLQLVYFVAILSGVSWAQRPAADDRRHRRDRRWRCSSGWRCSSPSARRSRTSSTRPRHRRASGLLGPVPAAVALTLLINAVYFGGAVLGGQASWRNARQRALLAEQASTIHAQSDALRRRAVTDERLRIARELHDVVGHHVSVIGIQAAAARRVIDRDPEAAATALGDIERSSREAVTQMRGLLGTLRDLGDGAGRARRPGPRAGHRRPARARRRAHGIRPRHRATTSWSPAPVRHNSFRRRSGCRSTASPRRRWPTPRGTRRPASARVVLRVRGPHVVAHAEVEVLDDGRPRGATSGSGLGHLGMRERAAGMRGEVEIGPRPTGGYRVRVRVPAARSTVPEARPDRCGCSSSTTSTSCAPASR